jgi:hypothetical protein
MASTGGFLFQRLLQEAWGLVNKAKYQILCMVAILVLVQSNSICIVSIELKLFSFDNNMCTIRFNGLAVCRGNFHFHLFHLVSMDALGAILLSPKEQNKLSFV